MKRVLLHRYDNALDILDVERRGYSDVFQRSNAEPFDFVAVVPTRAAKTNIAVVGVARSQQYDPNGGKPWPGRDDKYLVRIDVSDVRHTTVTKVRAAVEDAGKRWAAQWTVTYVDLDNQQLAMLGCGFEDSLVTGVPDSGLLPGEVPTEEAGHTEGAVKRVYVNAYERSDKARRKCLEHYGFACSVCDVTLSERYGAIAEAFIHVHHRRPLAEIGTKYTVDPVKDLVPVCPNCHAVIHLASPPLTIEQARALYKRTVS